MQYLHQNIFLNFEIIFLRIRFFIYQTQFKLVKKLIISTQCNVTGNLRAADDHVLDESVQVRQRSGNAGRVLQIR